MKIAAAFVLSVATLLAVVPASQAETITATFGTLRADLTYAPGPFANELGNLSVTRVTTVAYDAKVDAKDCGGTCYLGTDPADAAALRVMDLDLDGEPEIIANVYTGGAHCCAVARVLAYQPLSGTYSVTDRNFGDSGYVVTDVGDDLSIEFQGADSRFAYRFTAFAFSGLPILLYRFDRGVFLDVTKSYPSALIFDAAQWRKAIRKGIKKGRLKKDTDLRGFYAAWAADQYRLGHGRSVKKSLKKASRRGWLKGNGIGKQNGAFVTDLLRFLKRTGYR